MTKNIQIEEKKQGKLFPKNNYDINSPEKNIDQMNNDNINKNFDIFDMIKLNQKNNDFENNKKYEDFIIFQKNKEDDDIKMKKFYVLKIKI